MFGKQIIILKKFSGVSSSKTNSNIDLISFCKV